MMYADHGYDAEMLRLWAIVAELSEQLNQVRRCVADLRLHALEIKAHAVHSGIGFALRRFNLDLTKEQYESELAQMNGSMAQENMALQNDNKQLSALLKEYEQSLDSIMSAFRTQAHDTQRSELALTRYYESVLAVQESARLIGVLDSESQISASLSRISELLRQALRALNGEDDEQEVKVPTSEGRGYTMIGPQDDRALERECELARLMKENEDLHRLVSLANGEEKEDDFIGQQISLPRHGRGGFGRRQRMSAGLSQFGFGLQRMPSVGWGSPVESHWTQRTVRGYAVGNPVIFRG